MKKSTLIIILIFGFLVRLVNLNQSLWLDEATTANVNKLSYQQISREFLPNDFHPPGYYYFIKTWAGIFGHSEISLRFPSLIFSLLTTYIVFLITKKLIKKSEASYIAATLMTIAPLSIYYSQEARVYTFAMFVVSLSVFYYLTSRWLWFGLTLAIIAATNYLSLLILPVFWLAKKPTKKFVLAHIPLTITAIFLLPLFQSQLSGGLSQSNSNWWAVLGQTNLKNTLLIPIKFMVGRISFQSKLVYASVIFIFTLTLGYILSKAYTKFKKHKLIWYWLLVPLVLSLLIGFFVPVVSYFRLLFILPALYILLSIGLMELKDKQFLPAFLLIISISLACSGIYLTREKFHRENWRSLSIHIDENSNVLNSQIIFPSNSQMEALTYYNPSTPFGPPDTFDANSDQIWLMRYVADIFDPEDNTRKMIEESDFKKQEELNFRGVVVWRYAK